MKVDLNSICASEILDRISRHCPESLYLYLQFLGKADDEGVLYMGREEIEVHYSEDYTQFVSNVKKLARESLLEWAPVLNGIQITLASIEHDE